MTSPEILAQVLRLPRAERAHLAQELLSSLEEPDEAAVEAAWGPELERRSRDVAEGRVETVEWTVAREQIQRELAQRRARRTTS